MKISIHIIFCAISISVSSFHLLGQSPASSIKLDNSHGNIIKVIQGETVNIYDLSDDSQYKEFEKYLLDLPGIRDDLKSVIRGNNRILQEIESVKDSIFNQQNLVKELERYVRENDQLREEVADLKKQLTDTSFSALLGLASQKLANYDNIGYQKVMAEYIQKQRHELSRKKSTISNALYLQAKNSFNTSNYDSAKAQVTEALELDSLNSLYFLLMGDIQLKQRIYFASLSSYQKALSNTTVDSIRSLAYFSLATNYWERIKYDSAEGCLKEAIAIERTETKIKPDSSTLSLIYSLLGNVYRDAGKYDLAYQAAIEAWKIVSLISFDSLTKVVCLSNIGLILNDQGKYIEALIYFNKALQLVDTTKFYKHPGFRDVYNNIGIVFLEETKFDSALYYFKTQLGYFDGPNRSQDLSSAIFYSNIGSAYSKLDSPQDALYYMKKALAIKKAIFGEENPAIGLTYDNIAAIYMTIGRLDTALDFVRKSVFILNSFLGPSHPKTILACISAGSIFQQYQMYDSSLKYLLIAVDNWTTQSGISASDIDEVYNEIGLNYVKSNMLDSANQLSKRELAFVKEHFGKLDARCVRPMYNVGKSYFMEGKIQEAENCFANLISKFSSRMPSSNWYMRWALNDIGTIEIEMGNIKIGYSHYKSGWYKDSTFYRKALVLNNVGYDLYRTKDYRKAINVLNFVERILSDSGLSKSDTFWMILHSTMFSTHCHLGDKAKANIYFLEVEKFVKEYGVKNYDFDALRRTCSD